MSKDDDPLLSKALKEARSKGPFRHLRVGNRLEQATERHFTCDCEHKEFDHIHTTKIDYFLCSCDKIYKLTDLKNWEFVNYDSCYYCSRPKDVCVGPDIDCNQAEKK